MRRVLLTGATGFVGRHALEALEALVERGDEVHAVHSTSAPVGTAPTVQWHRADLLDETARNALLDAVRPTHLLHLAWFAVPGEFWRSPENRRWVEASVGLVRSFAAGGGQRVVLASTCAVYDWSFGVCSEESTPLEPSTVYGECKLSLERAVSSLGADTGLSSASGRLFFLYGPYEDERRLVPSVVRALLRAEPAPVTTGTQARDFLHVRDAASALVELLGSELEGPVNIGSGVALEVRELVARIGSAIGRPDLIRFGAVEPQVDEPPLVVADVGRVRRELGWRPALELDEGLAQTIAWWRAQRTRP